MTGEPVPFAVAVLNTSLIVVSGVFLAIGYWFIRRKQITAHRRSMLSATFFAALFLIVYVARAVLYEGKLFAGEGFWRVVYLAILASHVVLAIAIVPLVLLTLARAFRGEFGRHRRIARVTLPLWAYVVATGWIIFWFLYVGHP
jgi:putative membrane protein